MQRNHNKGFTLVEVVVAFAVLAIISGTLLQMFVTSAIVNQDSYEIDQANALATVLLERFKSEPQDSEILTYTELRTVPDDNPPSKDDITIPTVVQYEQFYDRDWKATSDTAAQVYRVNIVTPKRTVEDNGEMSFYQTPVYEMTGGFITGTPYTIEVINPGSDGTKLAFSITPALLTPPPIPPTIDLTKVKNGKVALLINSTTPTASYPVVIQNNARLTQDAFGNYNSGGTVQDFELAVYFNGNTETQVTLDPTNGDWDGVSSYSFVNASSIGTSLREMTVTVTRLKDNKVLAQPPTAAKYVVEQD